MNLSKIDIGRLIAVSVFTFYMTLSTLIAYRDISILSPINMAKALVLIHHILVAFFYALIIFLYLLRSSPSSTSRSFVTNSIAVLTTFSPSALSLLSKPESSRPEIVLLANFVIVLGMVLSICSLASLGRSFSIIPQARKLVRTGPYKLIRHPLYVSEIIGLFGVVLVGISISKMAIFFFIVGCQIYRAFQEEKLLAEVFPDYGQYRSKTARFIPGVF